MLPLIAIDGPAGSGKSTLARAMASTLGLPYVNTGLMYRALAAAALARHIGTHDEAALAELAGQLRFTLGSGTLRELVVGGLPQDADLEAHQVESIVSDVARHPKVRSVMRELQRGIGTEGAVMEGRDIGTAVFPDAPAKIFLWAAEDTRAGRRAAERPSGETGSVRRAVRRRDAMDARTNPPSPAEDAQVFDATHMSKQEVLAAALEFVELRLGPAGSWRS